MKGTISMKGDVIKNGDKQVTYPPQIFSHLMDPSNKILNRVGGSLGSNDFSKFFTTSTQHSNFLYVYFWYAYFLLLVPFRFQKIGEGKYEIHRWLPQQILCGFSNFLSVIRLFTTVRSTLLKIRGGDPISFFMLFCECSSFVFKVTAFRLFWTKRYAFKKLLNFLSSNHLVPYNPYKIESMKTISIFCGAYAVLSFLRMVFGSTFINYRDWSPEWMYRRLVEDARYTFFLNANPSNTSTAPKLEEITGADTFLAVIQGLSIQSRFITGFFVDLCILVHILSLWAPAAGFTKKLCSQIPILVGYKENEDISFEQRGSPAITELDLVLTQFEALKTLSILVGETIGDAIMPYIGEALFYYAIYFDSVVMTPDIVTRMVLIFFYISAMCILMFSAEVVRNMRWFKTWLGDKRRLPLIDQNQLAVILDDLSQHSIGITASGILTLNYPFVGTVVSVLITYFIIRLQTTTSTV